MYPPSISYSMYKIEHGVALSDAERSAADRRDCPSAGGDGTPFSGAAPGSSPEPGDAMGSGVLLAPIPPSLSPRRRRRPTDGTSVAVLRSWSGGASRGRSRSPSSRRSTCTEVGRSLGRANPTAT